MNDTIENVFKQRVLKSAKEHISDKDNIKLLNNSFNLKMGMKIEVIANTISEEIVKIDDELFVCELVNEIEGINKLYFWVSDELGLYSIFAVNEGIVSNGFGLELKKTFFGYEKIFELNFGKYSHNETSLDNLQFNYNSWLLELEKKSISLETLFNDKVGSNLNNDLKQILIGATKEIDEDASIIIVYKFNNAK